MKLIKRKIIRVVTQPIYEQSARFRFMHIKGRRKTATTLVVHIDYSFSNALLTDWVILQGPLRNANVTVWCREIHSWRKLSPPDPTKNQRDWFGNEDHAESRAPNALTVLHEYTQDMHIVLHQCNKNTVFENHRKSFIQHCEQSELRLHFEWTNVN